MKLYPYSISSARIAPRRAVYGDTKIQLKIQFYIYY